MPTVTDPMPKDTSFDLLLAFIDNLPELAWMAHPDGHIDFYNRRWFEYTGTTLETMAGWGWERVHDPEVLPKVVERWKHSLATGEPFEMEFPLRGADGQFRWFLTRVRPLRGADGKIARWIGTNTDVHELRETREQTAALLAEVSRQSKEVEATLRSLQTDYAQALTELNALKAKKS